MDQQTSHVYAFGTFRIDVSERQLSRDGVPVQLPPKVFDVLLVLVENYGRIVGKDELMRKVWADTFVEDANLTVNVSALRKVLGEDSDGSQFIETIPKRGYRFIAPVEELPREDTKPIKKIIPADATDPAPSIQTQPLRSDNVVSLTNWHHAETTDTTVDRDPDPEVASDPQESPSSTKRRNLMVSSVAAIIIAAVALSVWFGFRQSNTAAVASPISSIAVLPFENVVPDANAEYLSDGITESLINRLSQLSGLKVASRSSVFRYKGKEQETSKVGEELNVRAVLTGNVTQVDDQLVITVRLDDALTNQHIWGQQYVRKLKDILSVQNEIAQDVTSNLRMKLTGADEQKLAKIYTQNTEAYQLYLKGNYEWNKHTQEDLFKAVDYYNQSLEKDPNFALAYTGLATCYGVLGNNYLPPNDAFPKAKAYAAKALEIDDTIAAAHAAMAAVRLFYEWNWAETEKELERAKALDPNDRGANDINGAYLEVVGRKDESRREAKSGVELDPLSLMLSTNLGADLYYARQYDEAIAQLDKTIKFDPRYNMSYLWLGQALEQKKMYPEAIAAFQKGLSQGERPPKLLAALGRAYAVSGERDKANEVLSELREMSQRNYVSPYLFAVIYNGLGDKEQTFGWLDKAFQDRAVFLIWLKLEPQFDSLRDEPRFKDLLRRIGLDS